VTGVDSEELVATLEDAGLSPYQAAAYVTLLELGFAPATDIAAASGIPDPRIYDVLRDLEAAGYVETYEQDSLHAKAHSLEDVLEDLRTRATRFDEAAEEIERRWDQPATEESVVSIVTQFETVLNNAASTIESAENQVQLSMDVEQFESLRPALSSAVDNGATVKLSLHTGEAGAAVLPDREEIAAVCTEARHRRVPSPFVAIVDRTETCFAPHRGSNNEYGVLVEDRTHTYVFHWFFLTSLWDVWEPVYEPEEGVPATEYVDIRYCIRDIAPLVDDGATVRVRVEGIENATGEHRTVEGVVTDVFATDSRGDDDAVDVADPSVLVAKFAARAGLTIDAGDEVLEVGGWGATVEDLEGLNITVLSVTE
jgi:sugar-specific transcriptional regulator TrmB